LKDPARILDLGIAAALALSGALGCQKALDERDCERLIDHYTELLVLEENPGATPVQVALEMDEARALARKDPRFELAQCGEKVSRSSYDCAMAAPSVDAIERCMMF